ncbi:uncharacterized protein LOC132198171 [Neocloeon triangulifer]|uniref:uncharacterized protein LOC132198171 n=1 Tax=Neocloeon triangulifer TaxID=2078957 RepID=UPI00286ECB3A|nr:uncharacterized protein LOC132198171 [Neocloeon triangulifer]
MSSRKKKAPLVIPSTENSKKVSPSNAQQGLGVDITKLMSPAQINAVKKHISSGNAKQIIIIPNDSPLPANQPGTSTSQVLLSIPEANASQGNIAQADILISLPETQTTVVGSSRQKSKRGRPNKYIALDNGDIVRQSLPLKQGEQKTSLNKRKSVEESNTKEEEEEEVVTPKRRSTRTSANKSKKYEDFSDGNDNSEDGGDPLNTNLTLITAEKIEIPVTPLPKRKRGRPKVVDNDFEVPGEHNPKSSRKSSLAEDENNVPLSKIDLNDVVVCGACCTQMPRKTYLVHRLATHHGLTWVDGEDEPITFYNSDQNYLNYLGSLIREAFVKYGKTSCKKTVLPCQKCKKACASYMGYLSHFTFCGITIDEHDRRMYQCPICDRKVTPASRYYHDNTHKAALDYIEPPEFVDVGVSKRAAAVKARSFMQNLGEEAGSYDEPSIEYTVIEVESKKGIAWKRKTWEKDLLTNGVLKCRYLGCDFSVFDVGNFEKHICETCPLKAKIFMCSECDVKYLSEAEVMQHFKISHKADKLIESYADRDEADELEPEITKVRLIKPRIRQVALPANDQGFNIYQGSLLSCLAQQRLVKNKVPYRSALDWMLEFCILNYSMVILFPELFEDLESSILRDPDSYLPLAKNSILFTNSNSTKLKATQAFSESANWKSLACLEGVITDNVPTIFAGGPILSLAWCPTPLSLTCKEQLLAISCHRSMDSKLGFQGILPQKSLIQIWSLGQLSNTTQAPGAPSLFCVLGHEWGAVRQLEWCPSGCWDAENGKLGLLAAACADSTIRIIPIINKKSKLPYIKAKASVTLVPHLNQERLNQCISLNWYKGKGHNFVAGGYADGLVCFWNLKTESPLLKISHTEILPYLKFFAHQGPVVSIKMYPHNGPKFVATGGLVDKNFLLWNLEEIGTNPIPHNPKKGKVTAIEWLLNWPTPVVSFEDQGQGTLAVPPRNFMGQCNLLPQNSSTSDVEKSDWLNCIAHSTGAGEVSLFLCNQMIFGMDSDKNIKERRALLTRTVISDSIVKRSEDGKLKWEDPSDLFIGNYEEASERGVVFSDRLLDAEKKWPAGSESAQSGDTMDPCCSANYPLASINKIAWNANVSSYGWIAVGYQCGLVRVLHIGTSESDKLLLSSSLSDCM